MEFQFVIPRVNSDLLNADKNNYYVTHVYDAKEIPDALKNARTAVVGGDVFFIFDHFGTFFSVIENAQQLTSVNMFRSYDLLFIAIDNLGKLLADTLMRNEMAPDDRSSMLNAVKMLMFLMGGTVKVIDNYMKKSSDGNIKKGKKSNYDNEDVHDWSSKRFKCIVQMFNLLQLPLEKLWDPPVCEESFVDVLCDVSYRTLEQSYAKNKSVVDSVFQIFGTAIKRYNHALSFPVRILQILETTEQSIPAIASGVLLLYEEFGITSILSVLLKELIERLSVDAADTQTTKHFSMFLTELGTSAPKLMIPHLSNLGEELLNLESYVLRNCILQIMGEAIITELSSEDLSEELKETRDEFLEDLLNHMMDVSAHVRSKVLQIWFHIKAENAVPLAWIQKVLAVAVERLEDKALLVRKNAIALIKAFLEHNPYSAKLSLAELRTLYEEENNKLQAIRGKMKEQDNAMKELEKKWEDMSVELYPIIGEHLSEESQEVTGTQDDVQLLSNNLSSLLEEKKYKEIILLATKADYALGNQNERKQLKFEEQCGYYITLIKYYLFNQNTVDHNEEFSKIENTVNFLFDSIEFSQLISNAVPKLLEMLMSKSNSDVYEAIEFFTSAYLFGIKGTECGMQQMLFLVWSSDKDKGDSVTQAYKRVLFSTDQQGRGHSLKVVKNLCQFLSNLTVGHYTAMEVLVKEWVENNDIDVQMIQVVFEIYTMKLENITEDEARQALQLLIMISSAKASVVTANLPLLEKIGFEERGTKDPRIFTATLSLLINSVAAPTNTSKYYKRFERSHPTVEKTVDLFTKYFFNKQITDFDEIGTKTFDFIYRMVLSPDILCQEMITNIYSKLDINSQQWQEKNDVPLSQASQPTQTQSQSQSQKRSTPSKLLSLPTAILSRFIFIIGYIAMREMIYLDIDVYSNLKYRQELKEELKNTQKKNTALNNLKNAKSAAKRKPVSLDTSASNALKRLSGTAGQDQEPEEQLVGASAEDTIAEQINFICENEMLYSKESILFKFVPSIIEICKYPNKHKDILVQKSAVLALIRFMSVSSKFCELYMPFLMNIFQYTKFNEIKCNIVIGLSDFTFRFPNVIEPWTGHLYATLNESNVELRLTAVKMLSHLILHEMIRVKGQISDLAMCIVDPEPEIRTITEQFFKEIANKSNILYNVLPDIISRLSDSDLNLAEEKYHIIMKYIIGLINKDKQIESLVEKLCLRFRVTNEERQWRDIAYCLSLLSYTEKTIKKLTDNIYCFKDKVQIQEVYDAFRTIISSTSKLAKPELKTAVTEFEKRIEECLAIKEGEDTNQEGGTQTEIRNPAKPMKGKQVAKPKPKAGRSRRSAKKSSSSSESGSDFENQPPPRSVGAKGKKKVTKVIESDDSSDDDEQPQPKKGKSRRR